MSFPLSGLQASRALGCYSAELQPPDASNVITWDCTRAAELSCLPVPAWLPADNSTSPVSPHSTGVQLQGQQQSSCAVGIMPAAHSPCVLLNRDRSRSSSSAAGSALGAAARTAPERRNPWLRRQQERGTAEVVSELHKNAAAAAVH